MIRFMRPEDAERVAAIEEASFSQPWSQNAFLDSLKEEAALFMVAEEADQVVGYVGSYVSFEEAEITNVAIDPAYRKRGLGNTLLQGFLKEAQDRKVSRVVLEVRASNQPAICLYEKNSFAVIGTRKGFYEFPKEDALIMVWEKEKC